VVHGESVGWEVLAAIVADTFVELGFPPGTAFEFACLVAFFAKAFSAVGVWVDFVVGFG